MKTKFEEIYREMTDAIPYKVPIKLKPYIKELARIYAHRTAETSLRTAAANAKVIFIDGKTKEQTSHLMIYSGAHCIQPDADLILKTKIELP